jgi:hypothetical protein
VCKYYYSILWYSDVAASSLRLSACLHAYIVSCIDDDDAQVGTDVGA